MNSQQIARSILSVLCAALFAALIETSLAVDSDAKDDACSSQTNAAATRPPARAETFQPAHLKARAAWVVFDGLTAAGSLPQSTHEDDKPVEQTRKNIRVLKGLPESQLFPLMNFVGNSLGVHCDYCHVKAPGKNPQGDDNWLWEKDDKPEKLRAREMMKMVLDLNRSSFGGNQSVTCYSCHRGGRGVARVVPLPPRDYGAREAQANSAALPTVEQILNRYVVAVGGQEAASRFQTTVLKGTIERARGRGGPLETLLMGTDKLEIILKGTDRYLLTLETPQGVVHQGRSGDVGWVQIGDGLRQLSAADLALVKRSAARYYVIKVTEPTSGMRLEGTEKVGEREAYIVAAHPAANVTHKFFFDKQTGLLLREITLTETMLAPVPEQVDYEDYRDVDGVKIPFTVRTSETGAFGTATRRFTEVRHNQTVDDAVFNPPAPQK